MTQFPVGFSGDGQGFLDKNLEETDLRAAVLE